MWHGLPIGIVSSGSILMNDNYKFWKSIWDSKGESESTDLLFLDGYEHLDVEFSSLDISSKIMDELSATSGESILEVGCGAGFLARDMQDLQYTGVDYSMPIINKHKQMFPEHNVEFAEAAKLPFNDNSFDYVFCFGLFQYLPTLYYAEQTIKEMKRVSNTAVFLGDLKDETTRKTHFVYPREELQNKGYKILPCFYGSNDVYRYNAILRKK
jgi:ubiquinone/menaquinone biosynthesis C-methylase UbiE